MITKRFTSIHLRQVPLAIVEAVQRTQHEENEKLKKIYGESLGNRVTQNDAFLTVILRGLKGRK